VESAVIRDEDAMIAQHFELEVWIEWWRRRYRHESQEREDTAAAVEIGGES
jgi:hypothetical protein